MARAPGAATLDAAIEGSPRLRFFLELFGNSAVFPIANVLLELLLENGLAYFREPDFYAICAGALAQAAYLSSRPGSAGARRFLGNLIGPAVYTIIEAAIEGAAFFVAPHHVAYWAFSAAIGGVQAARSRAPERLAPTLLVVESVLRSCILFAMYAIFEALTAARPYEPWWRFFDDASHVFIASAVALLGLLAGLLAVTAQRRLALLHALSRQLQVYSEWFFGRALLEQAVSDPARLALRRRDRAIVFMDVRGFTAWSETQSPEAVVAALNAYYDAAEAVFERHPPVRFKFAADEVMAVFGSPQAAVDASCGLSAAAMRALAPLSLGAGVGAHWGPVVEGLVGAAGVKSFDVIGDTVNTAKRIEGAAAAGEILVSDALRPHVDVEVEETRAIAAKGKAAPLVVHRVRQGGLDSDQAKITSGASTLIA